MFIYVDGIRLDKLLKKIDLRYSCLWCSLLDIYDERSIQDTRDKKYVWSHARIDDGIKILPLLLCPEDWAFYGTVILAEVIPGDTIVTWQRMGVKKGWSEIEFNIESKKMNLDENGNPIFFEKIEWFSEVEPFVFDKSEYLKCIDVFRNFKIKQ